MLFLVGYSCFTSIYYVAFGQASNTPQVSFDWAVEGFFWLDLIFNFLQEYRDPETYEIVRSFKLIAKRYMFKGWFLVDFVSVFPFVALFQEDALVTRLVRLFRLPRLIRLIDISRFNQLMKSFFENSAREERLGA